MFQLNLKIQLLQQELKLHKINEFHIFNLL